MYNDKLNTDEQITAEEQIASVIFDYTDGAVQEEECAELGRRILHGILQKFRPDLFDDEEEVSEQFIKELEKRSMSSWTDEELQRYSQLTGQEEESECNCGADQVADQASHFAWCASLQDGGQEP